MRKRIREWMDVPGAFPPGRRNAITDVAGVRVGHCTLVQGQDVRTGVTVISPHSGDLYLQRPPCAVVTGNGYGKLAGGEQVREIGELESPVALTNTLAVPAVMQGLIDAGLHAGTARDIASINVLVGETNDGYVNNITAKSVQPEHAQQALDTCCEEVAEGAVGAGTGTSCFGYKGGIGTASRVVDAAGERVTIGVLVQTNYGGRSLELYGHCLPPGPAATEIEGVAGSCLIVAATDAPVDARQLARIARRAMLALVKTGSAMAHGSGDFCIAFSTRNLRAVGTERTRRTELLHDELLSPVFEGTVEAAVEAVHNSLCMAESVTGYRGHTLTALDLSTVFG